MALAKANQTITEKDHEIENLKSLILQQNNDIEVQRKEINRLKKLLGTVQTTSKHKLSELRKSNAKDIKKKHMQLVGFVNSVKDSVSYEGNVESKGSVDYDLEDLADHILSAAKSWQDDKNELKRLQNLENLLGQALNLIPGVSYKKLRESSNASSNLKALDDEQAQSSGGTGAQGGSSVKEAIHLKTQIKQDPDILNQYSMEQST